MHAQGFDPRQVMHSDTFEVFHYREPRPGGVEVHHHDFYEVYYLLNGQVDYWVDGRIIRMEPGDILLINPQELHRPLLGPETKVYERIVLWINKSYLEQLSDGEEKLSLCFDQSLPNRICPADVERPVLKARMHDLVREFYSRDFGSKISAGGLFLQLMVQMNRLALHTEAPDREEGQMSPMVRQSLSYIHEHISAPLSLEGIASQLYVSKYHLSREFKKHTDQTIFTYLNTLRCRNAEISIRNGQTVTQAALENGFDSLSYFSRTYKRLMGTPPSSAT